MKMPLNSLRVIPLKKVNEKQFLDFLNKDRVLHIFTIYDLRFMRDKTEIWVAFEKEKTIGYLFKFDKRIVHIHEDAESVSRLLDYINLDEPVFIIEPHHLAAVEKFF
jgi:hypothetical protein